MAGGAATRTRTDELLGILASEPERISPSALLRPVFQDQILPTSAYVGGPAELAYFAQSSVLYERILGRTTPLVPRLSVTLVEPAIAQLLDRHELPVESVFAYPQEGAAGAEAGGSRYADRRQAKGGRCRECAGSRVDGSNGLHELAGCRVGTIGAGLRRARCVTR